MLLFSKSSTVSCTSHLSESCPRPTLLYAPVYSIFQFVCVFSIDGYHIAFLADAHFLQNQHFFHLVKCYKFHFFKCNLTFLVITEIAA